MLDIFNKKAKQENEELRKQLEERDTLIEWWREEGKRLEKEVNFKTKELTTETSVLRKRVEDIEKEKKTTDGALDISIKAGVEKDKEIARLKNQIKDMEKNKNSDRRILLQRVFAITPQNIETFRMLRGMALNGRNKRIRNKYINKMADSMEAVFKVLEEVE